MLLALNKPYDVLSQFTRQGTEHRTLAELGFPPDVYPIGRLDRDSEGLLLLSDEAAWTDRLLNPRHAHPRTYHVQVEREISEAALAVLRAGVTLKDYRSRPARAARLPSELYPPRDPPIRHRKNVPTSWISLTLTEGKNRQVRHMTAAVGFPTLRLVRAAIGGLSLEGLGLAPGAWRALNAGEQAALTAPGHAIAAPKSGSPPPWRSSP